MVIHPGCLTMNIDFEWNGKRGVLSERKMFLAIEVIEAHLSMGELSAMLANVSSVKTAKLSRAFADFLGICGIEETPENVQEALVSKVKDGTGADKLATVHRVCNLLLATIIKDAGTFYQASGIDPEKEAKAAGNGEAGEMAKAS